MRITVIIQGPLITYGNGPNNSIIGFDASENTIANIKNISKAKFNYILSTWTPTNQREVNVLEKLRAKSIKIVINDTPTFLDPHNGYKHRLGIWFGIQATKLTTDYYVKIRTDMVMPYSFWDWISSITEEDNQLLYVSHLSNSIFYMGDFFYAGSKNIFCNFIESILSYKDYILYPSVSWDDGFKYAHHKKYQLFNKPHSFLFYPWILIMQNKKSVFIWNSFIKKYLGVLPQHIWCNILWRDKQMTSIISADAFKFNSDPILQTVSLRERTENILQTYILYCKKINKHPFLKIFFSLLYKII